MTVTGKRLLALDYGEKRIGIAVSDPTLTIAQGVESYLRSQSIKKDVLHIKDICREYDVGRIIMGMPLNMDDTECSSAEKARAFAKRVRELIRLEVEFQDERLTTVTATQHLLEADMSRSRRRKIVDKMAAVEILQSYLDEHQSQKGDMTMDEKKIANGQDIPEDEIVVLLDENDKECEFQILLTYDYGDSIYTALLPLDVEGFEEDEVLIMKVSEDENGEAVLDPVDTEEELDGAWEAFYDIYYGEDEEEEDE
jgi:putative Holliday junction resolvase